MKTINVKEKLSLIHDLWKPKVIAELNGQQVKISKVKGEFVWHDHKDEDELFFILKGTMIMEFRDKKAEVGPGELIVVPKGVEHRPIAKEEVWMMLFEPQNIKHSGDVISDLTVDKYEKI
ncbi:cupin domain-containing protein [Flagellimonas hymeniacidonis]|uniref:Cupin domain-containing protein n=1 Tax=Flagellimonas hymeniacidonis TaxID=2603628 RepID=A0A5C8V2X6_9FLAO|nr:cupin domain-containing protein [Flagellimonas hymeniacidonis]TXN36113.1 cupin domain-containing protein [Flagellimonas hymeniacidonis]